MKLCPHKLVKKKPSNLWKLAPKNLNDPTVDIDVQKSSQHDLNDIGPLKNRVLFKNVLTLKTGSPQQVKLT